MPLLKCILADAGIQVVKQAEEEASEDDTNGLWNGQPFKPLPAVDVPDLAAGCARAMSLQVCSATAVHAKIHHIVQNMFSSRHKEKDPVCAWFRL